MEDKPRASLGTEQPTGKPDLQQPGDSAAAPDAEASKTRAQQPDYTAIYEQIKDKPCHVVHVEQRLEGHNDTPFRTRAHLIERELQPIYEARTLEEINEACETAGRNLQHLNVFRSIKFLVYEEPVDEPDACTVIARLEEKAWYKAHAATYVQGGESTFEFSLGLHNALGRAEHLVGSVEYGMSSSNQFSLGWEQPRVFGLPLVLDVRGHQYFRNNQKASSFTERLRGIILGLKSLDGMHALQYELAWRSIADPSRCASRAVLAQCGDYLKSSLRYTMMMDRRNHATPALHGWALKSTSEVSGLGPGQDDATRYAKQQLDLSASLPLLGQGSGLTFNVGASAGLMLPWGDENAVQQRTTSIADRFFIGGLPSVRGFKYRGIGPTDLRRPSKQSSASSSQGTDPPPLKRDALGGDAFATLFAALTYQLPHPALQALKLQGQAFVNGGNAIQVAGLARDPQAALQEFGATWRWSAGLGLVLPTVFGRFEANYCFVLASQEHDKLKRGLQLGFAASSFF